MNISFPQIRNQPVSIHAQYLEIGNTRFRFEDRLNLGDSLGVISAQAILDAAEQMVRLTQDRCLFSSRPWYSTLRASTGRWTCISPSHKCSRSRRSTASINWHKALP